MRKISMRAARVDAKLTQKEVAAALGVGLNAVIDWEKGEKYPSMEQFERFCDLCGFLPSEIDQTVFSLVKA